MKFQHFDSDEEVEITIGDWLRLKAEADGTLYIRIRSTEGNKTELEFDSEGELTSLIRDLE